MIQPKDYLFFRAGSDNFRFRATDLQDGNLTAILIEGDANKLTEKLELEGINEREPDELWKAVFLGKEAFLQTFLCHFRLLQGLSERVRFARVPAALPAKLTIPGLVEGFPTLTRNLGTRGALFELPLDLAKSLRSLGIERLHVRIDFPTFYLEAPAEIMYFINTDGYDAMGVRFTDLSLGTQNKLVEFILERRIESKGGRL